MNVNQTPYSTLKMFAHPDKMAALSRGERVAPLYVRIKPTNFCNHHCNYCHYGEGKYLDLKGQEAKHQIPWQKLEEIIQDLGEMGVKAVTFSGGGEPLIYPKIDLAMKKVLERGIDLSIITNGQRLSEDNAEILKQAKWVRVSLDAASKKTYSKLRGIEEDAFLKVCSNVSAFAKAKPKACELGINFVVTCENADQVYEAGKLFFDLGVNHIKFTARITNDTKAYHEPIQKEVIEQIHRVILDFKRPDFKVINLYAQDFDLCTVFDRTYSCCQVKELVTVIGADSKMYFCHDKAYVENGLIGDLKQYSFKELWFLPATIEKFKHFDAKVHCKHHCVYDERNILLNSFLSLDQNHINFI